MDTSEIYVKMCDCEEVQKARDGTPEWYEKEGTLLDVGDFHVQESDGCVTIYTKHIRGRKRGAIWLPRQDQIQEMMGLKVGILRDEFDSIVGEIAWQNVRGQYISAINESASFTTMEQLWLAYYMWRKHSKRWGGEKWA